MLVVGAATPARFVYQRSTLFASSTLYTGDLLPPSYNPQIPVCSRSLRERFMQRPMSPGYSNPQTPSLLPCSLHHVCGRGAASPASYIYVNPLISSLLSWPLHLIYTKPPLCVTDHKTSKKNSVFLPIFTKTLL